MKKQEAGSRKQEAGSRKQEAGSRKKLGKKEIVSHQLSKRGAKVICQHVGDRVILKGQAALYMTGELWIEEQDYE